MFDQVIADMHVGRMIPEIMVVIIALLAILVDIILPKGRSTRGVQIVSLLGMLAVIAASVMRRNEVGSAFGGMVIIDGMTTYFRILLAAITFLIIAISERYIEVMRCRIAEYYLMLIFSMFGMMLMVTGQDLLIIFLGIETMSICLYALVGISRHKLSSNEGALKYFLLGAFTTGFMVYGIALLYGVVGSTNIVEIMSFFRAANGSFPMLAWAGVGMVMVGLGFKVALVPFHWWSPDAYEGAPTTVTAFMSTAPKAAAFAAFLRIFYVAFGDLASGWSPVLWWIAVLTMTFGNLLALRQDSVKRMLAFSSITHAGYIVVAVLSFSEMGASSILFYMTTYAIMNIGAFTIAIAVNRNEDDSHGYSFDDFRGLVYRKPAMALGMLVFVLALAGIPPTAGFFGKYYIFSAAVKANLVGLAIIGVLNSAASVYYYLRLIINMFLHKRDEEKEGRIFWTNEMAQVVLVCVILILLIGLFPEQLLSFAQSSVSSLM